MNNETKGLLQGWVDEKQREWQIERAQTQMTLGRLIAALEDMPPDRPIYGFGRPVSYRVYYCDLAFEPTTETQPVSELLETCRWCVGSRFEGYKGGDFFMHEMTPVWIADWGMIGLRLMSLQIEDGLLVRHCAQEQPEASALPTSGKFKKKPVVVDAFQMTKARRWDNSEWPEWLHLAWNTEPGEGALFIDPYDPVKENLLCGTLEGPHQVSWGDYIIRGVKGEIYPCKPDIFAATYEPLVEEATDAVQGQGDDGPQAEGERGVGGEEAAHVEGQGEGPRGGTEHERPSPGEGQKEVGKCKRNND